MWRFLLLIVFSSISSTEAVCNAVIDSFGPAAQGLNVQLGSYTGVFDDQITTELNLISTLKANGDITNQEQVYQFGTGSYSVTSDNRYKCSTGTGAYGYGVIRSNYIAGYVPGASMIARFTAAFSTTSCVNCVLAAGAFQTTDGVLVGMKNSSGFSIGYQHDGNLESRTLTLATAATTPTSVSVTVSGITVSVSLTATTAATNAFEITSALKASATLTALAYTFYQNTNMVVAVGGSTDEVVGTYNYVGSGGSTGSWVQNIAAQPKTEVWRAMADFNGGNDLSWLNVTAFNIYQISYGYLGISSISYYVLSPTTGKWVLMHTLSFAGEQNTPIFRSPNMRIGWIAYSVASGVNYDVYGGSASISRVAAIRAPLAESWSVGTSITSVASNVEKYGLSIRSRRIINNTINQAVLFLRLVSGGSQSTKGSIIKVYKYCTLTGTPNWVYQNFVNSEVEYDLSATGCTNGQLLFTLYVGATGSANTNVEGLSISLNPTEMLTVTAITVSGAAADAYAGVTWSEPR